MLKEASPWEASQTWPVPKTTLWSQSLKLSQNSCILMNIEEINWNFTAPKTHILVLKWQIIQNVPMKKTYFVPKLKAQMRRSSKCYIYGQCWSNDLCLKDCVPIIFRCESLQNGQSWLTGWQCLDVTNGAKKMSISHNIIIFQTLDE